MKSVLVVCFTDLRSDARVVRQINYLKNDYRVSAACFDAYTDGSFELIKLEKTRLTLLRKLLISLFLLLRIYNVAYRLLHDYGRYVQPLKDRKFDLIIANDLESLPFAFKVAGQSSKVFFDAHEFAPRQFEDRLYWRIFFQRFVTALCYKYIPRVDGMSTVNEGIARAYEKQFGKQSIIITNASDYFELNPQPRTTYPIRLIHHGIFNLSRQPHLLIDMMSHLDERFTLDLVYLLPDYASQKTRAYYEDFKKQAEATGKIRVLPPMKSSEIVSIIHEKYDVGVILIPPVNFNYENALPNKLFHCIQARMALATGPLKEIERIVTRYRIGVVCKEFTGQSMAESLLQLSLTELNIYKENSSLAAKEMNASFNKTLMLTEVKRLIG